MKRDIMVIRESIARIVSMLTKKAIKVTQRGSRAYVSYHPKTGEITGLNIPYIPDDASDEFIAAIQGFLDHEVGHVLFSDFAALKKATALGPRTANMANIVEDVFVERKMAEMFRGSGVNLEAVRKFYLERIARVKIEEALKAGNTEEARGYATVVAFRAWGGQTIAADFLKDPVMAGLVEPVKAKLGDLIDKIAGCDNSMECLDLAILCKNKLEAPKPPPPPPPPEKGEHGDMMDAMKKAAKLGDSLETPPEPEPDVEDEGDEDSEVDVGTTKVVEDDSGKTGSEDSDPVDGEVKAADGEKPGEDDSDEDDTDTDTDTDTDSDTDSGDGSGDSDSDDSDDTHKTPDVAPAGGDSDFDEDTEAGETPAGKGDGETADSGATDPLSDMLDTSRDFDEDMSKLLSSEAASEIHAADYSVFSTEWDQIVPGALCRDKESVSRLDDAVKDQLSVMQKQLERAMAAQARKTWQPGMRRGRIAPGSLFKTAVGDDRVFRQRFETQAKNTAVSLLVDCSGSMSCGRIHLAAHATYALACVMERLKLKYEALGFTTGYSGEMQTLMEQDATANGKTLGRMGWGRIEPLYMPVFKSFDGQLDASARSRIAKLTEPAGWLVQNVDGECVQIAARRLLQQQAERHVLIVLSDGEPAALYAKGLGPHLKHVVKQATAQGATVVGIGIQTRSVERYYPKHVVLNDVASLPTQLMAELSKLLLAP